MKYDQWRKLKTHTIWVVLWIKESYWTVNDLVVLCCHYLPCAFFFPFYNSLHGTRCAIRCEEGKYHNGRECEPCHRSCATCAGTPLTFVCIISSLYDFTSDFIPLCHSYSVTWLFTYESFILLVAFNYILNMANFFQLA